MPRQKRTDSPEWRENPDANWYLRLMMNLANANSVDGAAGMAFATNPHLRMALKHTVAAAAAERGLGYGGYLRRSLIAFVAYDLGIDWEDAIDLDPRMSRYRPPAYEGEERATRDYSSVRDSGGRIFGPFRIKELYPADDRRRRPR